MSFLELPEFRKFPKIPRLENEYFIISEKVDGTNGLIYVHKAHFGDIRNGSDSSYVLAGSKSKWLINDGSKSWDNHGFGQWVQDNQSELFKLPVGYHYGEWYGKGINRGYGLENRKFMLFDIRRYTALSDGLTMDRVPDCVELESCMPHSVTIDLLPTTLAELCHRFKTEGSTHVPGYCRPEGLVVRSLLSNKLWKVIIDK